MIINADCKDVLPSIISKYGKENVIIVSDPPFNIGYHYKTYHDKVDEADYWDFMGWVFSQADSAVVHYPEGLHKLSIALGKAPTRVCSWVYNSNTGKQHRDVAFYGVEPDFRKVTQPYKNPNDKRIKKLIAQGKTGGRLYDWWNVNQVKNVNKSKTAHPCQMPVQVMENIIGILPDKIIIDPFAGSGSTGIACIKYNKQFIGIEIDADYCEIAKTRLQTARDARGRRESKETCTRAQR